MLGAICSFFLFFNVGRLKQIWKTLSKRHRNSWETNSACPSSADGLKTPLNFTPRVGLALLPMGIELREEGWLTRVRFSPSGSLWTWQQWYYYPYERLSLWDSFPYRACQMAKWRHRTISRHVGESSRTHKWATQRTLLYDNWRSYVPNVFLF